MIWGMMLILILRGTILSRTYGIHKNLPGYLVYIHLFLLL